MPPTAPDSGPYAARTASPALRLYRSLREGVYAATSATGINAAVSRSAWRQRRLLILCYHGVSVDDEHRWSDLYISPALLDRRLAWLRRNGFQILSLDEAVSALYAGTLPDRSVALTFDDGAADFATQAMPVLARHAAPATVYLTTYYMGHRLPVFDTMLSYLMWKRPGRPFMLSLTADPLISPAANDKPSRDALQFRLVQAAYAAGLTTGDRQQLLVHLADQLSVDFDRIMELRLLQIMSPTDIATLDRQLIDLQLHTHRHRTPHDETLFRAEISDNRRELERLTPGRPTHHFCYPSGQYTGDQVRWLSQCDVTSATTCNPGMASPESAPLLLPRLIDSEGISDAKFAAWAHGTGPLLRL